MNKYLEFIKKRTCVRKYKNKKIEEEKIIKILEAGVAAPNAGNLQYWRFIIVRNKRT